MPNNAYQKAKRLYGYTSVVQCMSMMHEILGFVPSTSLQRQAALNNLIAVSQGTRKTTTNQTPN